MDSSSPLKASILILILVIGASCGNPEGSPPSEVATQANGHAGDPPSSSETQAVPVEEGGPPVGQPLPSGDAPVPSGDGGVDALAGACAGGDMASCDYLFVVSPLESEAEGYGDTCGGRTPADGRTGCAQQFMWEGTPGDVATDQTAGVHDPSDACRAGDFAICDAIAIDPEATSDARQAALLCGNRLPVAALPVITAALESSGPGCALTYGAS